ncbi:helix-turn-helix domain-containing protein [Chitinophaga sp. Cy-1792]|uniref:helix-turn-helix domain-containing protein n=1 Tax=Chitinophaga sp. Cy-1792 TaxID=2608339 RepID=UPI001423EE06|nr:helix-turn-helix domain-containing protein [Chitinophaga sp. Cy-1792]NIG53865.1 AraC family transcriptional regulator [Chitinophaga sp. Cy-1792]
MKYTQIQPVKKLQPYIRYFGLLESEGSCKQTTTFKIIADANPGLIFQEKSNSFSDINNEKLPQLYLHGLTSSNSQKTVTGDYCNLVVCLQTNAIKSIFGMDADELTDSYVQLNDIVKNNLALQLLEEKRLNKRITIISDFLSRLILKNKYRENAQASYAVTNLNINNDDGLHRIQSELNMTERTLQRMFKTNIGIPPKLYFRICRFQAALDHVRSQEFTSLTQIAHQHSYADQAHFIRDFRMFTGTTPKQFLQQANEQVLNFPEWVS